MILKYHFFTTIAEGDNSFHTANSNLGSSNSAHRRRTDLMPTITFSSASPAGSSGMHGTGNGYSRSSTPGNRMLRSPGKAVSMSRLDTLSKPRNLRPVHQNNVLHATTNQNSTTTPPKNHMRQGGSPNHSKNTPPQKSNKNWSKSMTHLGPKKLSPAAVNTKSKGK